MTTAEKEQIALAASSAHATFIRMDLSWNALQPAPPPALDVWAQADTSVAAARKYHLKIVAVLTETPGWASGTADRFAPPNSSALQAYRDFLRSFVSRYAQSSAGAIEAWEIVNEANTDYFWHGTAGQYAQLYSLAYDTIKSTDPAATILMAGMNEDHQPSWLDAVLDDTTYPAHDKIDVFDIHIRGSVLGVQGKLAAWKAIFARHGLANKPIWITEFGFPSHPYFQSAWDPYFTGRSAEGGEAAQAAYYATMIPWLFTEGGVAMVFVTLRDLSNSINEEGYEGFVSQHATKPKVALGTIRGLADRYQITSLR